MYLTNSFCKEWIRRCKERDFLNNQQILMLLFAFLLHSQSPFGGAFLFLCVVYTQLFFEFLKLHFKPFEYGHAVNAQPELSFLLRISLYGCRRVVCPELFPVLFRIEPSLELYGL